MLPLLHASSSTAISGLWIFDPTIVTALLVAGAGYFIALRQIDRRGRKLPPNWQVMCYYGGLLVVAVALLGPPDTMNDELFFMHMLQHLALMQIAAPLILLGRPVQVVLQAISPRRSGPVLKAVLRPRGVRWVLSVLSMPLIAALLFNGNLVLWHVPAFYDAALVSERVHELEHALFFGCSLLFWWPIIDPVPRHHRMPRLWAMAAVFASMVVGICLGAIITLAGHVIYPYYLGTPKPWGLSPLDDQQTGGLVMWVGGGFIYFGMLLGMLASFLGSEDVPVREPGGLPPGWEDVSTRVS